MGLRYDTGDLSRCGALEKSLNYRATGVDLAVELGATAWLAGPDLPEPQRKQYELQQRIREHLVANNWTQGFSTQQLIEALALLNDKATQMAVGQCLQLLGY